MGYGIGLFLAGLIIVTSFVIISKKGENEWQ